MATDAWNDLTHRGAPHRAITASAALIAGFLGVTVPATPAAAAEPCDNIVVSRVGDGAAALTSAGTAVFLDEYTPAGALVRTIPLPTTAAGANRRFVNSGSASSNLAVARSADGRFLTLAGYDAAIGTASVTGSAATAVNRVVARVDSAGTVDTTTALADTYSGDNFRSAVTDDGSRFWLGGTGTPGGVRFATLGATTSTSISTTATNIRWSPSRTDSSTPPLAPAPSSG